MKKYYLVTYQKVIGTMIGLPFTEATDKHPADFIMEKMKEDIKFDTVLLHHIEITEEQYEKYLLIFAS